MFYGLIPPSDRERLNSPNYARNGYKFLHKLIDLNVPAWFVSMVISTPCINLNVRDRIENTPLHLAIQQNKINIAMDLVDSGCDVNAKNRLGDTPLIDAVRLTSSETLIFVILEKGANVNEQNMFGHTAIFYSYYSRDFTILDLLLRYGVDHAIRDFNGDTLFMKFLYWFFDPDDILVEYQRRAIDFEADMNGINKRHMSTLFLAINSESPLVEEIVERGADVNYSHGEANALCYALRTKDASAFKVIWPLFDYQSVYSSFFGKPILAEFFCDVAQEDWFYRFSSVLSKTAVITHAIQHYNFHDYLPPLIAQVVRTFAKYDYCDENDILFTIRVLLNYEAPVFLEDIEAVYICYRGGNLHRTVDFILDNSNVDSDDYRFLSLPCVMLKVNRDVNSLFNEHVFSTDFKTIGQQFIFLPELFKVCTPTIRFLNTLNTFYDVAMQYYDNEVELPEMIQDIQAAYISLRGAIEANMNFLPRLIELSRNATRKAICLRYNIDRYLEYQRLLRKFPLPPSVVDILLFKRALYDLEITLPHIRHIDDYQPFA